MPATLTSKKMHKIARIDGIVHDYFAAHPALSEIPAKDLMKKFVEQGIFFQDDRSGAPIRNLLNQLERDKKLQLLKHVSVGRRTTKKVWHFVAAIDGVTRD